MGLESRLVVYNWFLVVVLSLVVSKEVRGFTRICSE